MSDKEATNLLTTLTDHLSQDLRWPGVIATATTLKVSYRNQLYDIVAIAGGKVIINFIYYNRDADTYGDKYQPSTLVIDETSVPLYLLRMYRGGYSLSYEQQIKRILQITSQGKNEKAKVIDVSVSYKRYVPTTKAGILKLPFAKFIAIKDDAQDIFDTGNSYRASIQRFLTNKYSHKHINSVKLPTTYIKKGEFNFLVHRLNLPTKRNKADFTKYLGKADISSLQGLTLNLIAKEVFDAGFLRKLDEYFIKEKLQRIIADGQSILSLKSGDLATQPAKDVLDSVFADDKERKKVKQLETLWQRFFEKYLLYLIFSYREIHSKVPLELEGDQKYPDFIGINHYLGVDVIEIKTHLAHALTRDKSHDTFCFSPELSKAIIQTTNYMDAVQLGRFKEEDQRATITETTLRENIHRPRGIIIISSSDRLVKGQKKFDQDTITRDFTKLRNSLHNIEILTFDEVLSIAQHYTANIIKSAEE